MSFAPGSTPVTPVNDPAYGGKGYDKLTSAGTYTSNFGCIVCLTDAELTVEGEKIYTNGVLQTGAVSESLVAGDQIFGLFTEVVLTSGTVRAYFR